MALTLPQSFKKDIQSRDTALVPVVAIRVEESHEKNHFQYLISTNSLTVQIPDSWNQQSWNFINKTTLPTLLNIPSLKESIDVENRNYKISSINLDISNLPYEGIRFSDLIGDSSIINKECRVFWVSPSVDTMITYDRHANEPWINNTNNAYQVYTGTIRRYDHDLDKVRIVVEDRTQASMHKDLPSQNIGDDDSVPSKYKNKLYPMVYGKVDRSPCLFTGVYDGELDYVRVNRFVIDSPDTTLTGKVETFDTFGDKTLRVTPLFIADSGFYWNCANETNVSNDGTNFLSYLNTDPFIDMNLDSLTTITENTSNLGYVKIKVFRKPLKVVPIETGSTGFQPTSTWRNLQTGGTPPPSQYLYDGLVETGWLMLLYDINEPDTYEGTGNNQYNAVIFQDSWHELAAEAMYATFVFPKLYSSFKCTTKLFYKINLQVIDNSLSSVILATWTGTQVPYYILHSDLVPDTSNTWHPQSSAAHAIELIQQNQVFNVDSYFNDSFDGGEDITDVLPTMEIPQDFHIGIPWLSNHHSNLMETPIVRADIKDFIINDVAIYQEALSGDVNKYDFYANVQGRSLAGLSNYGIGGVYQNAVNQIGHILYHELGVDNFDSDSMSAAGNYINSSGVENAGTWFHDYTINKKINSKTLIQQISSATPLVPRFDHSGRFKFDIIPLGGGSLSSLDGNEIIKEEDIIDFSFSRTKIEDVYSKIQFHYYWDYQKDGFDKITDPITADEIFSGYIPSHGLNPDHSESTLIVDDTRGKYIRNDDTAYGFAYWLLSWHMNQHLKIKVKLPLKFMNIEVGDIIAFNELLGGIKPYGIDYKYDPNSNELKYLNSQVIYPKFLVTSTNKTLESCQIEVIQMHQLTACGSVDCTGACGGTETIDACGECGGDAATNPDCPCCDCEGTPNGSAVVDICNDCTTTPAVADTCGDCPEEGLEEDECGICGGDNSTCADCSGDPNGNLTLDECGVCGGTGLEPTDEFPNGLCSCEEGDYINDCGTCGDVDICCNPLPNPWNFQEGVMYCGTDPIFIPENCCDCEGVPFGDAEEDPCGICEGDGSSCDFCSGNTPCGDYYSEAGCQPEDVCGFCGSVTDINECEQAYEDWEIPETDLNVITAGIKFNTEDTIGTDIIYAPSTGSVPEMDVLVPDMELNDDGTVSLNIKELFIYWAGLPSDGDGIVAIDYKLDIVENGGGLLPEYYTPGSGLGVWHTQDTDNFPDWDDLETTNILLDETHEILNWNVMTMQYPQIPEYPNNITLQLQVKYQIEQRTSQAEPDPPDDGYIFEREFNWNVIFTACPMLGDMNNDGGYNVLDIVALSRCVLAAGGGSDDTPCAELEYGGQNCMAGDLNMDGGFNVLDIVALANCVLAVNCIDLWWQMHWQSSNVVGDLNGDGIIDEADWDLLYHCSTEWNCPEVYGCVADINQDGGSNNLDLEAMGQWGANVVDGEIVWWRTWDGSPEWNGEFDCGDGTSSPDCDGVPIFELPEPPFGICGADS